MKRRDVIIEELHRVRERIGRDHGFDVDRIAATIRAHEQDAGRSPMTPARKPVTPERPRRRAAQHRLAADDGR